MLCIKNTKYYFAALYFHAMPANKRTHKTINQNLIKCISVQNRLGTKLIKWDSSRQTK